MPRADQPTSTDSWSNRADFSMHYFYVGGTAYHIGEYITYLAQASEKTTHAFTVLTTYLIPIWNFNDSVMALFNAKKDLQNKDAFSAFINTFSGLQLMAGTLVGQIGTRTDLSMAFGQTAASTISSGAFALGMFLSAGVAAYKEKCLQNDILNLNSATPTDEADIIERMILRNPDHKTALTRLQGYYFHASIQPDMKDRIRGRFTEILKAEQDYQWQAKVIWATCGIAMTIATLTLPLPSSPMLIATVILFALSGYARTQMRNKEDLMHKRITDVMKDQEPEPNLYFANKYRHQHLMNGYVVSSNPVYIPSP